MVKAAATFAVLILLGSPLPASACSCFNDDSPCQEYDSSEVVFVGLVIEIKHDAVDIIISGVNAGAAVRTWVRLLVENPLKGTGAREITVVTGGGGGDCGYPFEVGNRYLVYGSDPSEMHLNPNRSPAAPPPPAGMASGPVHGVSICGRTRELLDAEDDLALLQALVQGKPETRIFGQVDRFIRPPGIYEYDLDHLGGMPDVMVQAQGRGRTLEARTDRNGRYRFLNPPPGRYKVTVHPPPGFGGLYGDDDTSTEVEVTTPACSAEHDVSLEIDGRIGGRVVDDRGRPVADDVQVSVVTVASAKLAFDRRLSRSAYTNNGRYEFEGLPPGQYLLGVSIKDPAEPTTPYETTYYPSGSDPGRARVFTLTAGERLTGIEIRLPARLSEVTITGMVKRGDGTAVGRARIELYDPRAPNQSLFLGASAVADARGRFSVRAFRDREYLLRVTSPPGVGGSVPMQSRTITVRAVEAMVAVELVIDGAADAAPK
jgi:hypothetical protein